MLNQNQLQIIQNLSRNPRDCEDNIKAYLTYGHLFENNIAVTLANTYVIQGKPSLNGDAMAGVVRRYVDKNGVKICAYIRVVEWTDELCTIGTRRRDEMEFDIPEHTFTFTIKDAKDRGLLTQRAWKTMKKFMLKMRALTLALRSVFPDIIGQAYSADELAENMIKDEKERDAIMFASAEGTRPPQSQQVETKPQPKPNPFPKQFESTKTTADEILIDLDKLDEDKINEIAQEIKVYLFDVQLHQDAKEHVTQSCNRLKHKAFQCTIDIARKAMRQDASMSVLDQVKEYIVFGDPTDWSLHDQIFQMYT
tara:strand:- start:42 stop:968 length:927 start_codon:yes stop_codon:yes gene_type:complete